MGGKEPHRAWDIRGKTYFLNCVRESCGPTLRRYYIEQPSSIIRNHPKRLPKAVQRSCQCESLTHITALQRRPPAARVHAWLIR
jgi:hypothetical protein